MHDYIKGMAEIVCPKRPHPLDLIYIFLSRGDVSSPM